VSDSLWKSAQLFMLAACLENNPHRWPAARIAIALRAIAAGDREWMERTADGGYEPHHCIRGLAVTSAIGKESS
jgi:hypothetical protein